MLEVWTLTVAIYAVTAMPNSNKPQVNWANTEHRTVKTQQWTGPEAYDKCRAAQRSMMAAVQKEGKQGTASCTVKYV